MPMVRDVRADFSVLTVVDYNHGTPARADGAGIRGGFPHAVGATARGMTGNDARRRQGAMPFFAVPPDMAILPDILSQLRRRTRASVANSASTSGPFYSMDAACRASYVLRAPCIHGRRHYHHSRFAPAFPYNQFRLSRTCYVPFPVCPCRQRNASNIAVRHMTRFLRATRRPAYISFSSTPRYHPSLNVCTPTANCTALPFSWPATLVRTLGPLCVGSPLPKTIICWLRRTIPRCCSLQAGTPTLCALTIAHSPAFAGFPTA